MTKSRLCHKNVMATTKLCSCHIVMILSSKCLVYWKQTKKATVQEHCSTIGLPKVIILLLKYDNSFCHYFVMKTLMTWPHFLVNTFKTSRLKLLTTASRIPHYRVKLPHSGVSYFNNKIMTFGRPIVEQCSWTVAFLVCFQ